VSDVKVLRSYPEAARLQVTLADGTSSEHDWVRVEGRWVPKALADDWSRGIAQAKQGLAARAREATGSRQVLLVQLRMVDAALDGVLATKTAEEFQAAVTAAAGTFAGAAMAHAQGGRNPFVPRPRVVVPTDGTATSATDGRGGLPDLSPGVPGLDGAVPAGSAVAVKASDAAGAEDHGVMTTHPVSVRDARRYVGQAMHVVGEDGTAFDGTLLAVKSGTLTFQRESAAGTMTHDVALAEVESLAVWR